MSLREKERKRRDWRKKLLLNCQAHKSIVPPVYKPIATLTSLSARYSLTCAWANGVVGLGKLHTMIAWWLLLTLFVTNRTDIGPLFAFTSPFPCFNVLSNFFLHLVFPHKARNCHYPFPLMDTSQPVYKLTLVKAHQLCEVSMQAQDLLTDFNCTLL